MEEMTEVPDQYRVRLGRFAPEQNNAVFVEFVGPLHLKRYLTQEEVDSMHFSIGRQMEFRSCAFCWLGKVSVPPLDLLSPPQLVAAC